MLLPEKDAQPREATVRNFGQIIPSGTADAERFGYARVRPDMYEASQAEHDVSVRPSGSLRLASSALEMPVLEEEHARYRELGGAAQVLAGAQCRQLLPAVRADPTTAPRASPPSIGAPLPRGPSDRPATLKHP